MNPAAKLYLHTQWISKIKRIGYFPFKILVLMTHKECNRLK